MSNKTNKINLKKKLISQNFQFQHTIFFKTTSKSSIP